MSLSAEAVACALAARPSCWSRSAGTPCTSARERSPARWPSACRRARREVAPRDDTTLVSFASADAEAERERLAERGCVVRNIPGRPWLRASVGAWNDEGDLDRLLDALAA